MYSGGGNEVDKEQFFALVNQELRSASDETIPKRETDRLLHYVDHNSYRKMLNYEHVDRDNGRLNAQELVAASAILSAGRLDCWAAKTESTQKRLIQLAFSLENRPIDESPVVADKKV